MHQITSISLLMVAVPTPLSQARCEVVLGGNSTGILVPGHILEAAVQVDDSRYILFLTDDVIFEEFLTIALIDIRSGLKEIIRLGQAYSTGIFGDLSFHEASINFRFLSDNIWSLSVFDSPRLRFPFGSGPAGVKRAPGLKKYMTMTSCQNFTSAEK